MIFLLIYISQSRFNQQSFINMGGCWSSSKDQKERIEKLKSLLCQCESKQQYAKGIEAINDEEEFLKNLGQKGGTVVNKVSSQDDRYILFYSTVANFYYLLGDYQDAKIKYKKAEEKLENHKRKSHKVLKGLGDCYRHLKYENLAMSAYNSALDICDQKGRDQQKIQIWNSRGLLYIQKGEYTEAIADFQEAIKVSGQEQLELPLFYYNAAVASSYKGDGIKAIQYYVQAQQLLTEPEYEENLPEKNRQYLHQKFKQFIKKIQKIPQETSHRIRVPMVMPTSQNINVQITNYMQAENDFISEKWSAIQQSDLLYEVYYGMQISFKMHYSSALAIKAGSFVHDVSDIRSEIFSNILSWAPFIGQYLKGAYDFGSNYIENLKLKAKAQNIIYLLSHQKIPINVDYLWYLLFRRVSVQFLHSYKEKIQKIQPKVVLPAWTKKFSAIANFLDKTIGELQQQIIGSKKDICMRQYGQRLASTLIAQCVASKQAYQYAKGQNWIKEALVDYLVKSIGRILEEDLYEQSHLEN